MSLELASFVFELIICRPLPELGLFGIVRVYNPNSWITIPMTRIVGKIYENTKENKENKGAAAPRRLFSLISLVFPYILPTILVIGMGIQELGL